MKPSIRDVGAFIDVSNQVIHHSTMTMIHRALPPVPNGPSAIFNPKCISSARAALIAHRAAGQRFRHKDEAFWSGYIHWIILQLPFAPFMVLFCHIIAVYDQSDLSLLQDFVATLAPARPYSEGADKMYRLCNTFTNVATLYVEAKLREQAVQAQQLPLADLNVDMLGMEAHFDPYLSALGMAPNSSWPMTSVPINNNAATEGDMNTSTTYGPDGSMMPMPDLHQWFSGNRNMLEWLEHDLDMV